MKTDCKVTIESTRHQQGSSLAQLGAALDVFTGCTGNPKLPIQQARMFMHVAAHGVVLQEDLEAAACIGQSAVSRSVALLGRGLHPQPGYGLLESEEVPHNRRRNRVRLTEKGKALAWDMQQAVAAQQNAGRPQNASKRY